MSNNTRSHVDEQGNAHYVNTGRYNEVTVHATGTVSNDATSALKQTLVIDSPDSASRTILRNVGNKLKELIK